MDKILKFKTHWKTQTTYVHFGIDYALTKLLPEILEKSTLKAAVITDMNVASLYGSKIEHLDLKIFSFPPGESSKTRDTKAMLEDDLLSHNFGKDTLIIGLGGAVVTDLAGFLAATYCRGVSLIQIPTTLLAMVDASLGGKAAVNTPYGKNMIGIFYPPRDVLIDGKFLSTLPAKQLNNGIVEMIKVALIASPALFEAMENNVAKWKSNDLNFIMERIYESVLLKQDIVAKDPEEDKGIRRILNLGHTFGNVLETLEEYQIEHGEAIAIGILASCFISEKMGFLSHEAFVQIQKIFKLYGISPQIPSKHTIDEWMSALARDKKAKRGSPRMVLLDAIGSACPFEKEYCTEVDFPILEEAINWIHQQFYRG